MKTIQVAGTRSTGFDPALQQVRSIEVEDAPLGQGGFGVVYRGRSVNGRPSAPLVVKLLLENGQGVARRGFDTIQALQDRLEARNRALGQGPTGLLQRYPALLGAPQLSFEGTLEGRQVLGYASADLSAAGLEDFGRILEDDSKTRAFQALPLAVRIRLAAQLVRAFELLSSQALYIHADFKAQALFVDPRGARCAIIDFDSGALARDPDDRPTTYGTLQDWLAPEITRQLDQATNPTRLIKVDLLSDIWSVNIAVHYLLLGVHPLFFLSEVSERSVTSYFSRFQWPDVDRGFVYFRRELASAHDQYKALVRQLPVDLQARLAFTINRGYLDPTARTTYGQWRTVLEAVSRPAIRSFTADRTLVTDTRPVRLTWDITGAALAEILGVGDVTGKSWVEVAVRRDTDFTLRLTPDSGAALVQRLRVEVSKEPPHIQAFQGDRALLTDATPLRLSWSVSGAERIEISGLGDVTGRSWVDVRPRCDALFTLTAVSPFGARAQAAFRVRVSTAAPVIRAFQCHRALLTDTPQAQLSWDVSADAEEVTLSGLGRVAPTGTAVIGQRCDTTYVLRAVSAFGVASERRLSVAVSKEPPRIEALQAHPMVVPEGGQVELRWTILGAERAEITPGLGAVSAGGGGAVLRVDQDQRFTLVAESPFGATASASIGVSVLRRSRLSNAARKATLTGPADRPYTRPTQLPPAGRLRASRVSASDTFSLALATRGSSLGAGRRVQGVRAGVVALAQRLRSSVGEPHTRRRRS